MKSCPQTESQSVLEHGISVKNHLMDLLDHLEHGTDLKYKWKLPQWIYEEKEFILQNLADRKTVKLYTIMHDCGKPFCLEIDEEGRRNFPNHAQASYETFTKFYDDPIAAELILHDMDIHTLKSEGVEEFSKNPHAITLLISGLAEIHSNAKMFGGIDSTSFKIKWKCISQRGKQIINLKKNQIK
jgi:hypothetical protein